MKTVLQTRSSHSSSRVKSRLLRQPICPLSTKTLPPFTSLKTCPIQLTKKMPTVPDTSLRNTLLFLTIFILAFFPSTFQILLKPIIYPLELLGAEFSPRKLELPVCNCCPRNDCPTSTTTSSTTVSGAMSWTQKQFTLPAKSRGSYLITNDVLNAVPEIKNYKVGLLHLFIQHTSCALSLNENWDEDVREDMSTLLPLSSLSFISLY
jgi:hypothetical protein